MATDRDALAEWLAEANETDAVKAASSEDDYFTAVADYLLPLMSPPPGDEGEAVERVRRFVDGESWPTSGTPRATALRSALAPLLAAVSRLTAERDQWQERAEEQFRRAVEGRADAESVVQWGVGMGDEDVSYVFAEDEEAQAREIASHPVARLHRRNVGPWRRAE